MGRYILKRLGISLVTIWILATLVFILIRLLPGDPFTDEKMPIEIKERMMEYYHLNDPWLKQYTSYMGNLLKGDLGYSLRYKNRSVNNILGDAFPYSAELGVRAIAFSLSAGLLLGIVAALNHNKRWDYISVVIAIIGVSVPSFIIGGLLQYLFSVQLKVLPVARWESEAHKILPTFALGLGTLAMITRLMRTSMLEVISMDYIKMAKAKGLSQLQITWRHQIRNAILPVVTIMGPTIAALLTGTFVIENIFAIPGLGRHYVLSIQNLDYTMVSGLTIFYGTFLVFMLFLVDVVYGFIDPRIRRGWKGKVNGMDAVYVEQNGFEHIGKREEGAEAIVRPSMSYWQDARRRLLANKVAMAALVVIVILTIMAFVGPSMVDVHYNDTDFLNTNLNPNQEHWFGTDTLGRDMWARIWVGARVSLFIGLVAAVVQTFIGVVLGGVAGYFGGTVDMVLMRTVDILDTIPFLIYVILIMMVLGSGLVPIIIAFAITGWLSMARLVRGQVLQLKEQEFMIAAKALGASYASLIFKHLIPNMMGIIIVTLTMKIPSAIFTEAFLSYIGIGVKPPMTSWGQLANMGGQSMQVYPLQLLIPAFFISITMLSMQLFGDGLRDALDPKLRK